MELEQQYDRIKNQLRFEDENDTESKFPNIFVNESFLITNVFIYVQFLCKKVKR